MGTPSRKNIFRRSSYTVNIFYNNCKLLLLLVIFVLSFKLTREYETTADFIPSVLPKIMNPQLYEQQNANRTVYFLPGNEINCNYQYNYVCKFWFYIRCVVFEKITDFRIITDNDGGVEKVLQLIKNRDIIISVWRHVKHDIIPPMLLNISLLIHLQKRRIHYGIFHIATESNRENWPWYNLTNFVIRTYYAHDLPGHIQYIPLGPQFPASCKPNFIYDYEMNNECKCNMTKFKLQKSSSRKYLWSFSGSLRSGRQLLLDQINQTSQIKQLGKMSIASKFGGDGTFGSNVSVENPKTKHLDTIQNSMFVFCPCGNVMETHRIYEAIILGAIPVIEQCDNRYYQFFSYSSLLFKGAKPMIDFVVNSSLDLDEVDQLQTNIMSWWKQYTNQLSANVSNVIFNEIPKHLRTSI